MVGYGHLYHFVVGPHDVGYLLTDWDSIKFLESTVAGMHVKYYPGPIGKVWPTRNPRGCCGPILCAMCVGGGEGGYFIFDITHIDVIRPQGVDKMHLCCAECNEFTVDTDDGASQSRGELESRGGRQTLW